MLIDKAYFPGMHLNTYTFNTKEEAEKLRNKVNSLGGHAIIEVIAQEFRKFGDPTPIEVFYIVKFH